MERRGTGRSVARPTPGTGQMMVQTPIVELLDAHGCTPERFAGMVRSRRLGGAMRGDRYDTTHPGGIEAKRFPLPPEFPRMTGVITWRRAGHWSLDVSMVEITPKIIFHGVYSKTRSSLRISGSNVPETLVSSLIDEPLSRLVAHPFLMDQGIRIRDLTNYPAGSSGGIEWPQSIEAVIQVPHQMHRDACADWTLLR